MAQSVYQIKNYDAYNQEELSKLFKEASSYNSLMDHWSDIPGMAKNGRLMEIF
ncbi:hypothetical protein [Niabella sp.]|uniref:hypothetical protein n=1 Tax=Niabella sp. TaxID=1962976 RepID=UPI002633B3D3|nr:hypothetical protein [Niabella sp.]